MKVLVVGTGGGLAASGITTAADQLVRTLERMGHDPVRLVAGDRHRRRPNRLNAENLTAVLREATAVARAARRGRVDLVWLHTFGVPTLPAARALLQVVAARAVGVPTVVHLHAFDLAGTVGRGGRPLRLLLRLLGRAGAGLVVLHETDAEALRRVVREAEVSVLTNWVEVPDQLTTPPPATPSTVTFVGGLVARKGIGELLAAVRLLGDVPIVLRVVGGAGDDGEAAADAIRRGAADLVDTGRVVFLGRLDPPGVAAELERTHLLVLPSRAEGMAMAVLEAMARGRPVLVGPTGPTAELVRSSGGGWVLDHLEPSSIAEGLRLALQEGADRRGRAGRLAVAEHRSPDAVTPRIAAILLAVPPSRSSSATAAG